ncbi:MAG: hypothetical protein H3Z50_00895 [archaeon]|nr:hypothetical protein [archaeon]MCP8306392.1 hypothetical protein [archaeon]
MKVKGGILAIGIFLTVIGIFYFLTGYQRIAAIPSHLIWFYESEYNVGQLMEISGGILTALGLGFIVFGVFKKEKEEPKTDTSQQESKS